MGQTQDTIILSYGDIWFKGVTGSEKRVTEVCVYVCVHRAKKNSYLICETELCNTVVKNLHQSLLTTASTDSKKTCTRLQIQTSDTLMRVDKQVMAT